MNFDAFIECEFDSVSIVETSGGDNVLIRILDHKGDRWELTALKVRYFVLNGMCLQNIIEHIGVYDASNIDTEFAAAREEIFFLLQGRYPEAKDELVLKDVIEKIFQEIRTSQCLLLEIKPVYGAHIVLIAGQVSLVKVGPMLQGRKV